ncbi:GNAT family N-acetyltransferase [Streptomyces cinnabarinus]|uniref:GNAT family N-acetyltransferase n=1 Tax=Streptomyces cinnabarinus TaxID=67287 RepID=A0ABY7K455_9ACTN|nr:GNAT family N-acetyltransferase [Streptomyces cinnabarinus]WAZ19247.1 GNAT family N-acetyltransferase [Streptomyces cinnabarinus]
MSSSLRLAKISPQNVDAACHLRVHPDQERFVDPVVTSLAEAYAYGEVAWPRVICDGEQLVGFVMAGFDPTHEVEPYRSYLWRLNIAADRQRQGYGSFAVAAVCAEARRRGQSRLWVSWQPGVRGPEPFYTRLGFRRTGEVVDGEIVAKREL